MRLVLLVGMLRVIEGAQNIPVSTIGRSEVYIGGFCGDVFPNLIGQPVYLQHSLLANGEIENVTSEMLDVYVESTVSILKMITGGVRCLQAFQEMLCDDLIKEPIALYSGKYIPRTSCTHLCRNVWDSCDGFIDTALVFYDKDELPFCGSPEQIYPYSGYYSKHSYDALFAPPVFPKELNGYPRYSENNLYEYDGMLLECSARIENTRGSNITRACPEIQCQAPWFSMLSEYQECAACVLPCPHPLGGSRQFASVFSEWIPCLISLALNSILTVHSAKRIQDKYSEIECFLLVCAGSSMLYSFLQLLSLVQTGI